MKEAYLYEKLEENKVKCNICARECIIAQDKKGFCLTRENKEGKLYSIIYSWVSSENVDPIEKKPLYHFYPGSLVYSLGTLSCNFRCNHCQNWRISHAKPDPSLAVEIPPEEAVEYAIASDCKGIAWTYNEPAIWFEYTYDTAKLAKQAGLYTVYVTNGYITLKALKYIAPYLDAFRVDIKAFSDRFYEEICSAKLQPVLNSAKKARELGMHVEVINLIIPEKNDSEVEIRALAKWVYENLGQDTPIHFTRFTPMHKMSQHYPTPVKTLEKAVEIAKQEGLKYPYIGNVRGHRYENTYHYECGALLIERRGFHSIYHEITPEKSCRQCGGKISITGELVKARGKIFW
ncbi:MAG: AmmeMemoRadiSam system radical SAM enzyme [Methanocellales archaeon]